MAGPWTPGFLRPHTRQYAFRRYLNRHKVLARHRAWRYRSPPGRCPVFGENVMPLADLVRHLNARNAARDALRAPAPFVATEHGDVQLHFADLCLESIFLPIVETRSGSAHGHAASLRVSGLVSQRPVAPDAVFVLPGSDEEFIQLDRQVRTLHALNFLKQRLRGNLLLDVHPRHIFGVASDHGLAFEEILRPCGLLPKQITLELDISPVDEADPAQRAHLIRALADYRARGYGIAVRGIAQNRAHLALLRDLAPQIIRLDRPLLASGHPLGALIAPLRTLEARLLIDASGLAEHAGTDYWGDVDLVQAPPLPERAAALRGGLDAGAASNAAPSHAVRLNAA
ncbi:EAL domain-containing protein [Rhodocyclus tenuis]|nr:EAL domain-containing protein [Rhodocyclus gracilis]